MGFTMKTMFQTRTSLFGVLLLLQVASATFKEGTICSYLHDTLGSMKVKILEVTEIEYSFMNVDAHKGQRGKTGWAAIDSAFSSASAEEESPIITAATPV